MANATAHTGMPAAFSVDGHLLPLDLASLFLRPRTVARLTAVRRRQPEGPCTRRCSAASSTSTARRSGSSTPAGPAARSGEGDAPCRSPRRAQCCTQPSPVQLRGHRVPDRRRLRLRGAGRRCQAWTRQLLDPRSTWSDAYGVRPESAGPWPGCSGRTSSASTTRASPRPARGPDAAGLGPSGSVRKRDRRAPTSWSSAPAVRACARPSRPTTPGRMWQ